jgi:outer membrane cobalamin receptor
MLIWRHVMHEFSGFRKLGGLLAGLLLSQAAAAEGDGFTDMSLEELLNTKVEIAAKMEQTPEQAPSIVTVVTRQEMDDYGVRDLSDVLRMAGGFDFGIDVENLAGMSYRGIWVHEGKALIMINGQMINDFAYGNVNYLGSFPAAMIEKVEIIRGPGSALYGGFAEVAVINVITAKGAALSPGRVRLTLGAPGSPENTGSGDFALGGVFGPHQVNISGDAGISRAYLSGREFADYFGNRTEQGRRGSYRDWKHATLDISNDRFQFKVLHAEFRYLGQDVFGEIAPPVDGRYEEKHHFTEDVLTGRMMLPLGKRVTFEPLVEYIRGTPLDAPDNPGELFAGALGTGARAVRLRGELAFTFNLPRDGRLIAGAGFIRDSAHDITGDGAPGFQLSADPADVASDVSTRSWYSLVQYTQPLGLFGLTAGARYEHTDYGSELAPRAGLTFVKGKFNAKLLYGRAFRIPTLFQLYELDFLGLNLKPETANTMEMEAGWKFTPALSARLNLFRVTVDSPIVYSGATNTYTNFGLIRSHGVEGELRFRKPHVGAFVNFAWAAPGGDTSAGFTTPSTSRFLGQAPLKINFGGYWRPERITIAPSVTWIGRRAGEDSDSANGLTASPETRDYKDLWLVNLSVSSRKLPGGMELALTVHNIFNERFLLLQPYYGGHAPLPAGDRSLTLAMGWKL